jgi:hypothetical protein
MRRWMPAAIAAVLCAAPAVWAIEPAQAFLDGLRERKYYDVALEYLDAAADNPNVPANFKATIPYEKGVTLIEGAREVRDTAQKERQLDQGQGTLQQFIEQQPNHLLAVAARSQMGNVLVERARIRMDRARRLGDAEKAALHKEARGLYEQASLTFAALVEELREKLKSYPAALDPQRDAKRIEERDRYRVDFLQAQLLVAASREEMTDTMEKGSKEWTDTLTSVADQYKKIYEDYRTRIAGLYARMYQGRCLQKLGKHKEAVAFFGELLSNDDSHDAFRTLRIKVMALAVESWLTQKQYAEVIARAQPLVDSARPAEQRLDEMMAMRLALGRASKAHADELKKKNPRDAQIRKLLRDGRDYVAYVARFPGDYQDAARKLMPEFAGGDAESTERTEPKTFHEARTAAKDAIDALSAPNLLVRALPGRIATASGDEKAELQKQLDEARQQVTAGQADAMHYCRLALRLANDDVDVGDVNLVRYLLCYLLYSDEQYRDAAVVGEFVARHPTPSQGARASAKIAMASYLKLYTDEESDDKDFESARVINIADYIVKKWPDQPEAAEALNTLIPFMIREHKLQEAQDYLAQIPEDSPHRGSAELKTGQALWANYLEESRQLRAWESGAEPAPEGQDLAARRQELEELKSKAKETLSGGVSRMQMNADISPVLTAAALSLAQIYVDTNEPQKAVQLLEDQRMGPLTLVGNGHPAAQREGIPEETYKTTLRAYISSQAAGADAAAMTAKARDVMDSLKSHMEETPQGQARLVSIYVGLARDVQQQMEIAEPEVKKSLGVGFENFLSQIAADAAELNILNWVAETYRGMGESYGSTLKSLTPEAKAHFAKAAETYERILDRGQKEPDFLSGGMTTQIRMQLARTKKHMGDYIAARNILEEILKANPMLLPVQIEAARLYQDWGGTGQGQEANYLKAIVGDRPDPARQNKHTIWGWGEIARMTANNPQFRDQFYEARYNLALCRYNYALAQSGDAKTTDVMKMAKRDIAVTIGFYPDLGAKWRPLFDNLLKNIQKGLGERTAGLQALEAAAAPAASTRAAAN